MLRRGGFLLLNSGFRLWCKAVLDLAVRRAEENREQADQNRERSSWNGRNLAF